MGSTLSTARRPTLAVLGLTLIVASCFEDGARTGVQNRLSSPTPAATGGATGNASGQSGLGGDVGDTEAAATPSPTPTAPAGQATSSPTPGDEAPTVQILPLSAAPISVPPGAGPGTESGKPTALQLSALVTFADGSTSSAVVWTSLDETVATVSATGLVSTLGPGPGKGPWVVGIRASSQDGKAAAVRYVTVTAAGSVAVSIQ